jgi:hypothetical protein
MAHSYDYYYTVVNKLPNYTVIPRLVISVAITTRHPSFVIYIYVCVCVIIMRGPLL